MVSCFVTADMKLLLWCLLFTTLAASATGNPAEERVEALKEWVRSNGGFISPKLEFRLIDPSDPKSQAKVFAKVDISEEEKILTIPRTCLITSEGTGDDCDTTLNLKKQFKLKEKSKFWHYLDYLFNTNRQTIPSEWSEKGKALLLHIVGKELPPRSMVERSFGKECKETATEDPVLQQMYLTLLGHSWDDVMIPVLDMLQHRNGVWHNVDTKSMIGPHRKEPIVAHALRDIAKGEELYISCNECTDCQGMEHECVLQEIVRDYGFVEQFPQRWTFQTVYQKVFFDLDDGSKPGQEGPTELKLTMRDEEEPMSDNTIHTFHGYLKRLRSIRDNVYMLADELSSDRERNVTLEFYNVMVTSLDLLLGHAHDLETMNSQDFDALEVFPDTLSFQSDPGLNHDTRAFQMKNIETIESHYQTIDYMYDKDSKDTCLLLDSTIHACMSGRPHYHDAMVHYPASYLEKDQVKRVIFLGGGDNMLLHEILKYPSLELVVGLELDQSVVRSSFKYFGTQPYFDDERVQWWFGDAAQSLKMIPREYYGTFDVVVVDLITAIIDLLDIMNYVPLLMSPNGIYIRNEELDNDKVGWGTTKNFTDHAVDLYFSNVPQFGHIGFTMGSNGVNLLLKDRVDHGVEVLHAESQSQKRFSGWYNYRKASNTAHSMANAEPDSLMTRTPGGILLILEAEDLSVPLKSVTTVKAAISGAIKEAGLSETSVKVSSEAENEDPKSMAFVLKEGYVIARTWPKRSYCAFDVLLWSSFEKQEATKALLLEALGGDLAGKSSSSFRILTGGMYGLNSWEKEAANKIGPPSARSEYVDETPAGKVPIPQASIDLILQESLALNEEAKVAILLCGDESSCGKQLKLLAGAKEDLKVVALPPCSKLTAASDSLSACESDTVKKLKESIESNGKIDSIVIAPEAPREMGQILHKMFSSSENRRNLLSDRFVVMEISSLDPETAWCAALLDRFRTQFAKYDPAFRTDVLFKMRSDENSSRMRLGLFASGDEKFYSRLVALVAKLETKTNVSAQVPYVKNGYNNYIQEMTSTTVKTSHEDYDHKPALDQWRSQESLAWQSIFKLTTKLDEKSPSSAKVKETLEDDFGLEDVWLFDDVGDGYIVGAATSEGSIVVSWDGRTCMVLNLFTSTQEPELHAEILETFMQQFPSLFEVTSKDELPRGIGRVVTVTQSPHWAAYV